MILSGIIKKILEIVQNVLVPENTQIQKLLNMPTGTLRELLPKSPVYSKDIFVLFDYQNKIVRNLVKSIKYKNNTNLRKLLAKFLYEEILDISMEVALFEGRMPLLVPMPMSRLEKKKRGFNQCEELCQEIKKLGGENITVSYNTLKKIRETERQATLDRKQREQNVKNSMSVQCPTMGKIKTVIVLDDVFTTGATLAEARRALLSAGARRVIGVFIAH
ncbi:MAG: hypothetical protein AAB446_02820 [Patescibacteria group bacterium]